VSVKCWKYRSRSYKSRSLGVEQRDGEAVDCVCPSNAGFIQVGTIEVGVLGLNNGRGGGGMYDFYEMYL